MRIDGEVVFPDGDAINWRELHNALDQASSAEVLVKSIGGARLLDVSQFLSSRQAA